MKKFTILFAVIFLSATGFAQKKSSSLERQNVIKVNPLGIIFGIAGVSYERVIDSKSSVQFDANFGGLSVSGNKYTNLGAGINYRRFFGASSEAPKGIYISPGIGVLNSKVKVGSSSGSSTGVTFKGVLGNQWVFNSGFSIDVNAGIQYANITPKINNVAYDKYSGVFAAVGFSLGYAF
jgi:hypothetical protein